MTNKLKMDNIMENICNNKDCIIICLSLCLTKLKNIDLCLSVCMYVDECMDACLSYYKSLYFLLDFLHIFSYFRAMPAILYIFFRQISIGTKEMKSE